MQRRKKKGSRPQEFCKIDFTASSQSQRGSTKIPIREYACIPPSSLHAVSFAQILKNEELVNSHYSGSFEIGSYQKKINKKTQIPERFGFETPVKFISCFHKEYLDAVISNLYVLFDGNIVELKRFNSLPVCWNAIKCLLDVPTILLAAAKKK